MFTIEDYPIKIEDFKTILVALNIDTITVYHDNRQDTYDAYDFKFSNILDSKHIESVKVVNDGFDISLEIHCFEEKEQ